MSEDETFQKYRSWALRTILDSYFERARGRGIDESVVYKTFRETVKNLAPNVTDKEISEAIKEYKRRKNKIYQIF